MQKSPNFMMMIKNAKAKLAEEAAKKAFLEMKVDFVKAEIQFNG